MWHKRIFYGAAAGLLVVLVLAYANHFNNGFQFDDAHTIQENPYIRSLGNIPKFFQDASTFSSLASHQNYRPMVTTSLAIDYWLGHGLKPFFFHLSMFLLYVLQCVLIFFLFRRILEAAAANKYNPFIALFGAGWYALHTANAETLNYIISRSDSFSTLGVVAGLFMYAYSPTVRKWHIYLIPLVFGLLCKETAFTFVGLMFCYVALFEKNLSIADFFRRKNRPAALATFKAVMPALVVCALFALINLKLMSKDYVAGGARYNYMITQPYVMLQYFLAFFLPIRLSADTDFGAFKSIFDGRCYVGFLFVIAMLWGTVRLSSKKELRPMAFGVLWFFIALLPSSSIIPLAEVMNDHRMFFPFIGLALATASGMGLLLVKYQAVIARLPGREALLGVLALLIIGGNAYGVHERNRVWHDGASLWHDVTIKSPKNGRGLMNYGLSLMSAGRYPEALAYFQKALLYVPNYSYLHVNLGIILNAMGRTAEAEAYFRKATQLGPVDYVIFYHYANFLLKQKRYDEALWYYEKSIARSPSHLGSRHELTKLYLITGRLRELRELAAQTLALFPGDQETLGYLEASRGQKARQETQADAVQANPTPEGYLQLSLDYYRQGQFQKCADASLAALKLKPDYAAAYNNLCSAYNSLGKWSEAISACEGALKILPDFTLAKGNLQFAHEKLAAQGK